MSKQPPGKRTASAAGSERRRASRRARNLEEQPVPPPTRLGATPPARASGEKKGSGAPGRLLVVGIGASAGGLQALEQFFAAVPKASGLAFVVVQHLERHHPSLLAELLARCTAVPVRQAADGDSLGPDRVFVIPPNATLTVTKGVLRVTPPADEPRMPIDVFFRSLAGDRGELAAGVVLSGTGSDGTFGLRAIKEQGGLTLAQVPDTAKHASMPQSAIAAGFVDEILTAGEMPGRLLAHVARLTASTSSVPADEAEVREFLPKVCELLRRRTSHDFGRYKEGTLVRRIRRRIQLLRIDSMAKYYERLAEDPDEPNLLLKDLLIGVTQFFREPAAFQALAGKVISKLLEGPGTDRPLRVWVPGCASGEEAYSIAILLQEQIAARHTAHPVQIFATDIDAEAIAGARTGRYRSDIAEQVSPERLARFFAPVEDGYQVVKELRDMCIFSVHNLIRDPPFSSLDLISCRNLLIYLEPELHRKVIPLLHYALRRSGFLFLGSSEELTGHHELFAPLDKKHRILQRKDTLVRPTLEFPLAGPTASRGLAVPPAAESSARDSRQTVLQSFERMLLEDFAPASAVVDERGEILCLGGKRGLLLQPPGGLATNNLLDYAEGRLRHALRTALAGAVGQRAEVVGPEVITEVAGAPHRLRVTVRPAPAAPQQAGLYAIVVEDLGATRVSKARAAKAFSREPMFEQLEKELRAARADLQASNEELEGAIEELKSSNEELLSTNEELQSANEELQTSKEELQSVNEELETVNSELRQKVQELGVANSDLQNLFTSTQVATIFLDRELKLAKFTPAATALFHFIDADVGRPLSDLAPRFAGTDLLVDVAEVLRTLVPVEREIRAGDAWFILRVLPYRTLDDSIAGAVITFADVTKLKRAETALREGERLLRDVIDGSPFPVFLKDLQGRFLTINKSLEKSLGMTREQIRGKTDFDLFPREKAEYFREHDRRVAESRQPAEVEEVADLPDGHHIFLASKFPLLDSAGRIYGVGAISHDISGRKRDEAALQHSRQGLRHLAEASVRVMRETNLDPMFKSIAAAALELTGARIAVVGHGYVAGRFVVGGAARAPGMPECPPGKEFALDKGGVYMELLKGTADVIRLTDAQMRAHPRWWGLPEGHVPMRGLLGARLVDREGRTDGMILVTDKEEGDFTEDDESLLRQLGALASLAVQHVEARVSLEEADQRKNEFLAMLSHELRTPLAPIKNSLYVLEHGKPDANGMKRAQSVIHRQVAHLVRLVEDLLEVTRVTRGKIRLEKERLDLTELVDRTVEDYRALFSEAGIELRSSSRSGLWVDGDKTRLAQVVGNLLRNAVKFTPRGGVVSVSLDGSAGANAVIRVRDTGDGVSPELLSRLFQPFTQADRTLDRTKGGLGLGLALVKGVVEQHGGAVAARSEGPGRGSEFEVVLPTLPPPPAAGVEVSPTDAPPVAPRRVLIIEDNRDAADSLREVVELGNHSVAVAYSASEGLELAKTFRPDVILCDIGLPVMDGYQVARAIRADAELASATLVALTGYAAPEDIIRSREAGFAHHLAKPPSIEAIERVLSQARDINQPPNHEERT